MSNHDEVLKAAHKHMLQRQAGGMSKGGKKLKDVNCGMCRRKMTVREFENHPYYCWTCDEELEAALQ